MPSRVQSVPGPADGVLRRASRSATTRPPRGCDLDAYGAWCRALLARGVYPPASQFEAWFPSLAHTEEDVERTLEAAARGVRGGRLAMRSALRRERRRCATALRGRGRDRSPDARVDEPRPARSDAARARRQLAAAGPRAAGTRPSTSCCSR